MKLNTKHVTEKDKKQFAHAQKIWRKYQGHTALFKVTCWDGSPVHEVRIVSAPDPTKAPAEAGYFPEIGFFGIGSTCPPSGKGVTSVGLNNLQEV